MEFQKLKKVRTLPSYHIPFVNSGLSYNERYNFQPEIALLDNVATYMYHVQGLFFLFILK